MQKDVTMNAGLLQRFDVVLLETHQPLLQATSALALSPCGALYSVQGRSRLSCALSDMRFCLILIAQHLNDGP